jgi:hypothetical protein
MLSRARPPFRFAIVALLLAPQAFACDLLLGAWKSDGARTVEYMKQHSKFEPRQEAFLSVILGHMIMEFEADEVHVHSPDLEVPASSGGTHLFKGMDERRAYRVLDCGERSVAVSSRDPSSGRSFSSILYFDGADAFWIYTGSNDPDAPDLHLREYFKRVDASAPSDHGR